MKRMWSKNELKNIADVQAKAVQKDITTLVDAQGHERFIDGDIEWSTTEIEGITLNYGKWALSGSHLLLVVALSLASTTVIPGSVLFKTKDLPKWIYDKLRVLFGTAYVDKYAFNAYNSAGQTQAVNCYLKKENNVLYFDFATVTLSDDRNVRISFDLLIGNE